MGVYRRTLAVSLFIGASILVTTPENAFAQGQKKHSSTTVTASISLTPELQVQIRDFYSARGTSGAKALPPGIRKRLARGKRLPPGIAKQVAPAGLRSRVRLPAGYEIIEVGLDVVLVEIATDIVHDVLMDIVR